VSYDGDPVMYVEPVNHMPWVRDGYQIADDLADGITVGDIELFDTHPCKEVMDII
jgi:hypothetical protein